MTSKPKRAARTPPAERRDQLIAAAIPQFAEHGYTDAHLQAIADDVGVTRNLIHRYFPGGKRNLYVESVRVACEQLASLLDIDPGIPPKEKTAANIALYVDVVFGREPIYVLYSRAERSAADDVRAHALRMRDALVARIAFNNFGTADPSPAVAALLNGFVTFAETSSELWREHEIGDRAELEDKLRAVFASVIAAARATTAN